jgi:hypothetical protein
MNWWDEIHNDMNELVDMYDIPEIEKVGRKVTDIVIHCSDSPGHMDIGAEDIDRWHKERGYSQIGYHFVIRRNGKVEIGRPLKRSGAHCKGINRFSIGVCLAGRNEFNDEQFDALRGLVKNIKSVFTITKVAGHRDYPSAKRQGKTCPNFEVSDVL